MRLKTLLVPALLVAVFAVPLLIKAGDERARVAAEREAVRARHEKAEAMFQERCKKAGEFIYRTAENVEGIFLLKLRPDGVNYRDQYRMDDPYGSDGWGDDYIKSFFLEQMLFVNRYQSPEMLEKIRHDNRGYRYVDTVDPKDGKRYRYTGSIKIVGKQDTAARNIKLAMSKNSNYDLNIYSYVLDRAPASDPAPRYGITYEDISTREERDYWIAGSSLKVIDLETNEVIAERIGYMMDRGQGNESSGRAPWLFAADNACPSFRPSSVKRISATVYRHGQTRKFVTKVVQPSLER
jgi:hypothetical protein